MIIRKGRHLMKKLSLLLAEILCVLLLFPAIFPVLAANGESTVNAAPNVIPNVQQWTGGTGDFLWNASGRIVYDAPALQDTAALLAEELAGSTGLSHTVLEEAAPQTGDLFLTLQCTDTDLGGEGYRMEIADAVTIRGTAPAGVFYGTRTLLQMLRQEPLRDRLPRGVIRDYPETAFRGYLLDVARKYVSEDYLLQYVRQLADYKYNVFHLHFNDDDSFRLECESYPLLTSEQHYTKAFIRSLQDLAARYHITILPEIDLPSHASAIIAAYPQAGHTPGTVLNPATPGLRPLDLSKEESFTMARAILNEWVPLFDGPYFHIGGDEYPGYGDGPGLNSLLKQYPEMLSKAQSLGLETEADLFYYFLNSMGGLVRNTHHKTPVFWEWAGRFADYTSISLNNTMVFDAWQGPEAPERSAQGFSVINSNYNATYIVPGTSLYPDLQTLYEQWQPHWLNLAGTSALDAQDPHLLGAKFHSWNDDGSAYNEGGLDRFTLPPLAVFAEALWGAPRRDSYAEFREDSQTLGYAPGHGADLLAAWSFEKSAGDQVLDTSGYQKTAVLLGPDLTDSGKYGRGLTFHGGSDRVLLHQPDRSGNWTVSLWVRRSSAAAGDEILLDSPNGRLYLAQGDSRRIALEDKTTSAVHEFSAGIPVGPWCFLTLSGTPDRTLLYLNGTLADTVNAGIPCPLSSIGGASQSLNAAVDEVRVYGRALSGAAVQSAMEGLQLSLSFEEEDGSVTADSSGMNYNAALKAPASRTDSGKHGRGLRLSGSASEAVICRDDIQGPWTVSLWVNRKEGSDGGPLLWSYRGAIGVVQGKPRLTVHGTADYSFQTTLPAGCFQNLTLTCDGSSTRLYLDGVYQETLEQAIPLPLMTVGYWWAAFDGDVDELRAYDRVLSDEEIAGLVGCSPVIQRITNASVTLTWNAVAGARGYRVFRAPAESPGEWTQLTAAPLSVRTFTDRSVVPGSAYLYRIGVQGKNGTVALFDSNTAAVPSESLVSQGKTASAGYSEEGYGPENAVDGDPSTYWDGGSASQWWQLDLGEETPLTRLVLRNYDDGARYYHYIIQASCDGVNWVTAAEKTDDAPAVPSGDRYDVDLTARYLRVTTTYGSAGNYVHIRDFKAYGLEPAECVSRGKPVTVSAGTDTASCVNDLDAGSFWDGGATPQWACIDLEDEYDLQRVVLKNYYGILGQRAYTYSIEGSLDGQSWFPVAEKTDGAVSTALGDSYAVNVQARFLRATVTGNDSSWGSYAHISDFRAYGQKRENIALGKPVTVTGGADTASLAVDDDPQTFWDGGGTPQSLMVDLLAPYRLDSVLVKNYYGIIGPRYYHYTVEASLDGTTWTPIAQKDSAALSTALGDRYALDVTARYLRVTVEENSSSWGSYAHISDLRVTGQPVG